MRRYLTRISAALSSFLFLAVGSAGAAAPVPVLAFAPLAVEAPEDAAGTTAGSFACTSPAPIHHYSQFHCYTPADIAAAYGLDKFRATHAGDPAALGAGKTVVLVDSYGSPTAANDLAFFAAAFNMPAP